MSKRDAQKAKSSYHSSEHAAMLEYIAATEATGELPFLDRKTGRHMIAH